MTENQQLLIGESVVAAAAAAGATAKAVNYLLASLPRSQGGGGDVNGLTIQPQQHVERNTTTTKPHHRAVGSRTRKSATTTTTKAIDTPTTKRLTNGAGPSTSATTTTTTAVEEGSDTEEGFLSTSPDSQNGEMLKQKPNTITTITTSNMASSSSVANITTTTITTTTTGNPTTATIKASTSKIVTPACILTCGAANNKKKITCVTLRGILEQFKSPLSEEHSWGLLYQLVSLYRKVAALGERYQFTELDIPDAIDNICIHSDGAVHCAWSPEERLAKEQKIAELKRRQQSEGAEEHEGDDRSLLIATHKRILTNIGVIIYSALDYNLQADEQCQMSRDLEDLITHMTADENDDDCIDEGIDEGYKRWDDEIDDEKFTETKEFDYVLEVCANHIKPFVPEVHYVAVCHALVSETLELKTFLQHVLTHGADNLKSDTNTSKQELAKLGFNDWARFWVQVIDELRRGVRLKKSNYERVRTEYELTPYEILMEDIRSKKYQLRKVMINGDIPPRVKKDAHAVILDFIRSRPPLKKASERKLQPLKCTKSPREQLMDSIRQGQTLKHITPPTSLRLKDRLLPPGSGTLTISTSSTSKLQDSMCEHATPRTKQRLIKVDFSLLQDDDIFFDESSSIAPATAAPSVGNPINFPGGHGTGNGGVCSQPKMPPYPIGGYMTRCNDAAATTATQGGIPQAPMPAALTTRVPRRTKDPYTRDDYHRFFDNALESYDLATQCESRRASARRHTIVGCQSNLDESHSMPPTRPESRQSDNEPQQQLQQQQQEQQNHTSSLVDNVSATKLLHNTYNQQQQQQQQQLKRSQSPQQQQQKTENSTSNCSSRSSSSVGPWNKSFLDEKTWNERGDDRLSLTLEEIVHIRSVMTKAELEGLPVGVRVKEDVEKRKVCFLCLRTRFSIFGPWGIQCKLCQRTVCSKCYTKMRIPSEHFRNVPLVLISPSLLASPAGSSTPSPSHHGHNATYYHHQHSSSTGNILDETFPKSLIERLLRSESERKTRNSVGSAPSSPKHQRSNMSTPGIGATPANAPPPPPAVAASEALHDASSMTMSACAMYSKQAAAATAANNKHISIMSRSMEGPRSLPVHSPARPHSNSSTLDRRSRFPRAFTLSASGTHLGQDQKENNRCEQVPVCNDCKGLVMEITNSSKRTRSSARNRTLKNLTLDLSPVYK